MDFSGRLAQANGRLKAGKVGVSIEQDKNVLCLRAIFPPRPGSSKQNSYQQRLYPGFRANIDGLRLAEQEARIVGSLLQRGQFTWSQYIKNRKTEPQTCGDWIEHLRQHYINQGGSEETWSGDYWKRLKLLPQTQALTQEVLHQLVLDTTPENPNSRTRQRTCMAVGVLAKFAGITYDPSPYRGKYGPDEVDPRELPTDTAIAEWFHKLKNPSWRWVFGMMATYGLRNHEVFKLDLESLLEGKRVVRVLASTKTGARQVWPFYPEWVDEFELLCPRVPPINLERSNPKIGHSVTEYFNGVDLPFNPYLLRHAWAVRTLAMGLPWELAARQMGHGNEVHRRTYHRWLSDEVQQQIFEAIAARPDRPQAPKGAPPNSE